MYVTRIESTINTLCTRHIIEIRSARISISTRSKYLPTYKLGIFDDFLHLLHNVSVYYIIYDEIFYFRIFNSKSEAYFKF